MYKLARFWLARPWVRDLGAVALLTAFALVACGFLLRDDLFIFGDHPGQFMRLWYPVRESGRLLGWNPLWYAGYPELQFYPPGFVLLGWLLDGLTLGRLSPFALYQLLLFVGYLLPGISIYFLLSRVTGRRWAGLVGGALALVFAELWGGATAIFVGLVAERLAFGLVPLVMLTGWQALHAARPARWWLATGLALAATLLMHPFHAAGPALFLGAVALLPDRDAGQTRWWRLRNLALVGLGALLLAAFWLLPLIVHGAYAAPLIRADLDQTREWLFGRGIRPYLMGALLAAAALLTGRRWQMRAFAGATLAMGVGLAAFALFDHLVLLEGLGFYLFDPVRFSAEVYLAWVLLLGLGLAYLPIWLSRWHPAGPVAGILLAALALTWLAQPFIGLLQDQRDPAHFYGEARGRFDLDASWEAFRPGQGRVLFTSYYLQLGGVPTALKAATPYFSGRTMVGGTFSHWGPVARALWVGNPNADLLPGRVELIDDVSLAGRPWDEWTDASFFDLCHRLNVMTVAATWDDERARAFLDAAPHFRSSYSDEVFVLYDVLDPAPALVEVEGVATAALQRAEPTALDLIVEGAVEGDTLRVKIAEYPLWRAEVEGQSLAPGADDLGLIEIQLPPGSYQLRLRYRAGAAEWAGAGLSLAAAAVWLILAAGRLRAGRSAE
jgi:hypothetical protein